MFSSLRRKGFFTYFTYEYKNVTNLGNLYLLPKSISDFFEFRGRSVISNCCNTIEKYSEILDHHMKKVIQKIWSYIKDFGDFIKNIYNLDLRPENAFFDDSKCGELIPTYTMESGFESTEGSFENNYA